MMEFGLYIHIPFCTRKCPYCDFNTYAGLDSLFQDYVDALCLELARAGEAATGRVVNTLFLGGGTPTVLPVPQLAQILEAVRRHFYLAENCEITSEANPGTVDRTKFANLRSLGVNRLSMGIQSLDPDELRFLGRIHSAAEALHAFEAARNAGFENINLDFIFGLPDQTAPRWQATLAQAGALAPEHLSLYSLIVEPNTPLHHWVRTGEVVEPDEDQAAVHYEIALEQLEAAGYIQYEVSNWARACPQDSALAAPTWACRHNLIYWRNQEYLGVGPGAHSHLRTQDAGDRVRKRRWANRRPVPSYIQHVRQQRSVVDFEEEIPPELDRGETMMLGLRLVGEGVAFARFRALHGVDLRQVFAAELARMEGAGLMRVEDRQVRLTRQGLMVGNQVFAAFLPEPTLPTAGPS